MASVMSGPGGTATIGATVAPMPASIASTLMTDTSITIHLMIGPRHIAGDDTDFRPPLPLIPAKAGIQTHRAERVTMRSRLAATISVLVLAGTLVVPADTAGARNKSGSGGTATSNNSQGTTTQKAKKRPPRAYSGKDAQPAARDQNR